MIDQLNLLQPKAPSVVEVKHGLCQDVLAAYPDDHFGAMVTDPPYGLSAPPDIRVVLRAWLDGETYEHGSSGFMGQQWDSFVPGPDIWSEVFRVLKPGAFCVVFTGQRTIDLMGIALRLAGFEIRDLGAWLYWSGFPKNYRPNQDPRFCQCACTEHSGESTADEPQPADHTGTVPAEHAGDPRAEDAPRSTSASPGSRSGCSRGSRPDGEPPRRQQAADRGGVPSAQGAPARTRSPAPEDGQADGSARSPSPARCIDHPSTTGSEDRASPPTDGGSGTDASSTHGAPLATGSAETQPSRLHTDRSSLARLAPGYPQCNKCGRPNADGMGTALKPASEPFLLVRKPLEGTIADNILKWGVGALNIDATRYAYGDKAWPGPQLDIKPQTSGTPGANGTMGTFRGGVECMPSELGRWPANVYACPKASRSEREAGCEHLPAKSGAEATGSKEGQARLDSPRTGAGRTADEVRNHHPTVKSLDLMRWLVRLVTPPGETVLDPFLGSGTTMCAALREKRDGLGIEADEDHVRICEARMAYHRGVRR